MGTGRWTGPEPTPEVSLKAQNPVAGVGCGAGAAPDAHLIAHVHPGHPLPLHLLLELQFLEGLHHVP